MSNRNAVAAIPFSHIAHIVSHNPVGAFGLRVPFDLHRIYTGLARRFRF
jgi:hypothetical protein